MIVLDPGHEYLLDLLDGEGTQRLVFVKREGAKYPGNQGTHPGTNIQEVLRALIERCTYLNHQQPCEETSEVTGLLIEALCLLEIRAARRHGRRPPRDNEAIVSGRGKCSVCGHVGCQGTCERGA